jgi:hypothetical protein
MDDGPTILPLLQKDGDQWSLGSDKKVSVVCVNKLISSGFIAIAGGSRWLVVKT